MRIKGGEDVHPFIAPVEADCFISECPGMLRLVMWRSDGTLLQRPGNEGPSYRCDREGCYYHDNPRGLHEINRDWLQNRVDFTANMKRDREDTKTVEVRA